MGDQTSSDHCHCQGHRLLVIIGDPQDNAIHAALQWALTQTTVEHRIHYPATPGHHPKMRSPLVPNATNDDWVPYSPVPAPPAKVKAVSLACMLCCYYEEVIIIAHGHQQELWQTLLGTASDAGCLPDILRGKKLKKFVLWVCETAAKIYPHENATGGRRDFEWLTFLISPPLRCPCGCDPALCNAWNPGGTRKNLKCPHAGECVTLLSAAWYDKPTTLGGVNHHAASLSLDSKDTQAPFTSPDGRVLRTTICAIWLPGIIPVPLFITDSQTTRLPTGTPGITIFNGAKVKADVNDMHAGDPLVSPDLHTGVKGRTIGLKPPKLRRVRYTGPTACPTLDGCLSN